MRTGPQRPVRIFSIFGAAAAAISLAAGSVVLPSPAVAQTAIIAAGAQGISDFYAARNGRPLWFSQDGRQVDVLLEILNSAEIDGLPRDKYRVDLLGRAAWAAQSGKARAVRRADMMLSQALVDYVRDLRQPGDTGVIYVDSQLRPGPPSPRAILEAAAGAPSLERYVAEMRWAHPIYGQLRNELMHGSNLSPEQRDLVRINLERAKELPATGKHILVNAAAQRLFMYENGEVADSMRVVVGKPIYPTPMMAAYIRYTALNPYWYVPADLGAERIAPNVVKSGLTYLRKHGYEVVSDFDQDPQILDAAAVDWKAVADGRTKVLMRQLPGPGNSMGRMKFMFPNAQGIYLHDTPDKELLSEASRLFSGGCVRLEDAPRLGRWLYGRTLDPTDAGAETKIPLEDKVPVFITYLTAVPDGAQLAFFDDIYGRDRVRLTKGPQWALIAASR
jgi:murein L,D-transpeptidase YcbB/YkuD